MVPDLCEALEGSPDAAFITDRHNRVLYANPAARTLLGHDGVRPFSASCDAFLGGHDLFDNRYCAENCPVMQMAARGEAVKGFRMRLRGREEGELVVDLSILHLAVPPPEHYLLVHVLRPVTRVAPLPLPAGPETRPPRSSLEAVRESPDVRARRLTAREVEVLGMLAAGRATAEIASRLNISALTARNHVQNILEKLEVHSKSEAVAFAFQKRLI